MAAIVLPHRWRQQPGPVARVDRNNPLARGLELCVLPTRPRLAMDAARGVINSGSILTFSGGAAYSAMNCEVVFGVAEDASSSGAAVPFYNAPAWTQIALAATTDISKPRQGFFSFSSEAAFFGTGYANPDRVFSYTTNGEYVAETGPGFFEQDKLHAYGIVHTYADNTSRFYRDGRQYVSGNSTTDQLTGLPAISGSHQLFFGWGSDGGNKRAWRGPIYFAGFWNRGLSAVEMQAVSENPWQLFQPLRPKVYSFPSGKRQTVVTRPSKSAPRQAAPTSRQLAINTSSPFARGLVAAISGDAEWVARVGPSLAKSQLYQGGPNANLAGVAPRCYDFWINNSHNSYIENRDLFMDPSGSFSSLVVVRANSATPSGPSYDRIASNGNAGTAKRVGWAITGNGDATPQRPYFFWRSANDALWTGVANFSAVPQVPQDRWMTCAFSRKGSRGFMCIDGRKVTDESSMVDGVPSDSYFHLGADASTSFGAAVSTALFLYWNRDLTESEATELTQNPWQLFEQPRRVFAVHTPKEQHSAIAIVTSKTRAKQQPATAACSISHEFSNGVVEAQNFAHVGGGSNSPWGVWDAVRNKWLPSAGWASGSERRATNGGRGLWSMGEAYFTESSPLPMLSDQKLTVMMAFAPEWNNTFAEGLWSVADTPNDGGPALLINSSSQSNSYGLRVYSGGSYFIETGGVVKPSVLNTLALVVASNSTNTGLTFTLFLDGVQRGVWSSGAGWSWPAKGNITNRYIGAGYSQPTKGTLLAHAVWNRALPLEQACELTKNPWAMFVGRTPTFYSLPPKIISATRVVRVRR